TMCQLNDIGAKLATIDGVNAITDVTGFGLGGHLIEVCQGSKVSAVVNYSTVPTLPNIHDYLANGCSPGGAQRNFDSYGQHLSSMSSEVQSIICDPQTSGGLLIMVSSEAQAVFEKMMQSAGFNASAIGEILPSNHNAAIVTINE
ncbi:MAG: AIR synthase-related protein, partial [Candidatus Thioglobus sp.]|uniref:AIR synthase-related protein n=1 Tax=Candidatus Thioglobus sp. TaxID=2026721 RepID=UPI002639FB22